MLAGSTWQSLERGAGTVEVDWLNGEIVLLGRLHGVPTPVNDALRQAVHSVLRTGVPPRSLAAAKVEAAAAAWSEGVIGPS
jgi:2-dehydropantoate 2-reductase